MKISNINWISKSSQEAEVKINDGKHKITLYSQPCEYSVNQEIDENIHPLEVKNFRKSLELEVKVIKLSNAYYSYRIVGLVHDIDHAIISVGSLKFELNIPIPSWAEEGDLIEFDSIRFDLW